MLDVDVGLYSARTTVYIFYCVQDTFVSNTPLVAMACGSSGPGHRFALRSSSNFLNLNFIGSPPQAPLTRDAKSGSGLCIKEFHLLIGLALRRADEH